MKIIKITKWALILFAIIFAVYLIYFGITSTAVANKEADKCLDFFDSQTIYKIETCNYYNKDVNCHCYYFYPNPDYNFYLELRDVYFNIPTIENIEESDGNKTNTK